MKNTLDKNDGSVVSKAGLQGHLNPLRTFAHVDLRAIRQMVYIGVFAAVLIVGIHHFANDFAWYWIFRWFDNPMHILGGALAGYFGIVTYMCFVLFLHSRGNKVGKVTTAVVDGIGEGAIRQDTGTLDITLGRSVLVSLISAFIVGISWEFLEYCFGLSGLGIDHRVDTIADVINDMMGGITVAVITFSLLFKLSKVEHKGDN
jgi:hypothetical protein